MPYLPGPPPSLGSARHETFVRDFIQDATGETFVNKPPVYDDVDAAQPDASLKVNWVLAGHFPDIIAFNTMLSFQNKLWTLGGWTTTYSPKVWSSLDGVTWTEEGTDALPAPMISVGVVFHDKMWLLGSTRDAGTDLTAFSSTDGTTWTPESTLPFLAAMAAIFDNKIWISDGFGLSSSRDGVTWTPSSVLPAAFQSPAMVAFEQRLWIVGPDSDTGLISMAFSTEDGVTWRAETPIPELDGAHCITTSVAHTSISR